MDISKHLGDVMGSRAPVARTQGTVLEYIRGKYTARREAERQPEVAKIEEVQAEHTGGPNPPAPHAPPDHAAEPAPEVEHKPVKDEELAEAKASFKAIGVDEFGVITLVGGASGSPDKLDLDEEFVAKGDLVKMAFDFCSSASRAFKANHADPIDCDLVENWVGPLLIQDGDSIRALKADEKLTKGMVVKGVGLRDESDAGAYWLVGVRPKDPAVVKAAKEGMIAGASWGAACNKVEV